MSFKKYRYKILKKAVSKEMSKFIFDYFMLKRQVCKTMLNSNFIDKTIEYFGIWDDAQVPNTYSHYSDIVMETLLIKIKPLIEKSTHLKLIPNYSYARIYKKGDILKRHKDRIACEISVTLNLGTDLLWPIYIESDKKKIKINLSQGDILVYKGNELYHWRESFQGQNCAQVFLHYNNEQNKIDKENIYDSRPHLGLPEFFCKNNI